MQQASFIARHGLWTDEQKLQAEALKRRVEKDGLKFIRLAWADAHGYSRAKIVTIPAFLSALADGFNIGVAAHTLDSAGARVFASFTRGGGMGLDEMTGSPSLTAVPDPSTFRVLPWAPGVGWMLCDEYFNNGTPFHFSPRQLLRKQIKQLAGKGMGCVVGVEIEWYLLRAAQEHLTEENVAVPGTRGRPIATWPVEPGYHYYSESNMDLMQPMFSVLGEAYETLGLPLRSIENEWGPGQVECTFAPTDALQAADNLVLFRTATRQLCRRMGYLASFMCRPKIKGACSSGWHLHQSVVDADTGANLLTPQAPDEPLSSAGKAYLGGLLEHALAATVFANPTVNAYRRFRPNSLAPDRLTWGTDHRGVMLRVLAARGNPASRIENRLGEPAANPYLYIASQIITGLDGVDNARDPGPPDTDPYSTDRARLPGSLSDALDLMEREPLFRREMGDLFIDYYVALKRTEVGRFTQFVGAHNLDAASDEITDWEQNEYFDFF